MGTEGDAGKRKRVGGLFGERGAVKRLETGKQWHLGGGGHI